MNEEEKPHWRKGKGEESGGGGGEGGGSNMGRAEASGLRLLNETMQHATSRTTFILSTEADNSCVAAAS
jgi:hypothetical protein